MFYGPILSVCVLCLSRAVCVCVCVCVCKPAGYLGLVILCSSISVCQRAAASVWSDHSKTHRKQRKREEYVYVCVCVRALVCPGISRWWWIILWICIFKRWRVFCLRLICHFPFFSSSPHPLILCTCFSLSISYIISGIIIPPLKSEPTHSHLAPCAWACVCVSVSSV